MLRHTCLALKISQVAIPTTVKSLAYTHNYRRDIDYNLGKRFGSVNEQNRYEALSIIFENKLNGHVGRRQYKMQCAGTLKERIVEPLTKQGIDWHDLKGLGRDELLDLCELLQLDSSTRTVFLAAIESKMCGVLTKSGKDRNPRTICTRPGRLQHGWRCGVNGHSHNSFFEGKPVASASALTAVKGQGFLGLSAQQRAMLLGSQDWGGDRGLPLRLPRGPASLNGQGGAAISSGASTANASDDKGATSSAPSDEETVSVRMENGIQVEHRRAPDFSIVGRMQDQLVLNPRVWASPDSPTFNVTVMGFELRVHPDDPRVGPQIVNAHKEWELHGEAVRHVIWEMLELYGVERKPQPLAIEDGELGEPDSVFGFSSAFWGTGNSPTPTPTSTTEEGPKADDSTILASEVAIERRMITDDGHSVPWFTPPLPQQFKNGVPTILPFAPTIIVRGVYRQVSEVISAGDAAGVEKRLHYPLLDISILKHPSACFWWSEEDEEKAIGHALSYSRRVPFALPFNLYLRVDPSRVLRRQFGETGPGTAKKEEATYRPADTRLGPLSEAYASDYYLELRDRQKASAKYFDLANFKASAWLASMDGLAQSDGFRGDGDEEAHGSGANEAIFGTAKREVEDARLPWSYDEEVTTEGDTPTESGVADDVVTKGRTSTIATEEPAIKVDDDDDLEDALFPRVNPKGWE